MVSSLAIRNGRHAALRRAAAIGETIPRPVYGNFNARARRKSSPLRQHAHRRVRIEVTRRKATLRQIGGGPLEIERRVDPPQLGQGGLDLPPLALEQLDLLDAFLAAQVQGSAVRALLRRRHQRTNLREREAKALALQDQRQTLPVLRIIEARRAPPARLQ